MSTHETLSCNHDKWAYFIDPRGFWPLPLCNRNSTDASNLGTDCSTLPLDQLRSNHTGNKTTSFQSCTFCQKTSLHRCHYLYSCYGRGRGRGGCFWYDFRVPLLGVKVIGRDTDVDWLLEKEEIVNSNTRMEDDIVFWTLVLMGWNEMIWTYELDREFLGDFLWSI